MPEKQYKNYDDLPIFLNAQMIAGILGVSPSSAYELLHAGCGIRRCTEDEEDPSHFGKAWSDHDSL